MSSTLTISKEIFLPNLNAGLTYPLDTYAPFGYTVTEVYGIQTSSGTVTAALQINNGTGFTNITGLSSISVTSTPQNVAATAANTVNSGGALQIVFSSSALPKNIQFTLAATRNAVSSVSNSDGTLTISPTSGDVVASLASLASAKFLVGNGSNVATGVSMSGDATLANTGAVTIANNAVTNAKAAQMAANTIKGNLTGSTANVADNTLAATSTALAPTMQSYFPGGFVNKFRNGTMDIWQRGTSGTITAGTPAYTADGWIVSSTGANIPWAQSAANTRTGALSTYSLLLTGATSVTDVLVKQRIESFIAQQLEGQTVTVQAQVYNNTGASITPTLTVNHAVSTDNWTTTPTTDISAVNLQACANASWTKVAYTFTASASSGNGLEIIIDFGNHFSTSGKSVQITELDIRATPGVTTNAVNSSPPTIELRPIQTELSFCQRYLPSYLPNYNGGSIMTMGKATSTTFAAFTFLFGIPARAQITGAIISSSSNFSCSVANGSGISFSGSLTYNSGSCTSAAIMAPVASGLVAGNATELLSNTSSASVLFTGAEL